MHKGRKKFKKYKKIIYFFSKCICIFPKKIRIKMFEFFRGIKGKKGIAIRYILLKTIAKQCGENVVIYPDVYLFDIQNLSLGNNVSIHPMSYLDSGTKGQIIIGNDVSIAHSVTILGFNHKYDNLEIPIKDQGNNEYNTIIEDNVWIGAKATILAGRTIREGSVVAANCVVSKDVGKNTIVGGIPNKILKERK